MENNDIKNEIVFMKKLSDEIFDVTGEITYRDSNEVIIKKYIEYSKSNEAKHIGGLAEYLADKKINKPVDQNSTYQEGIENDTKLENKTIGSPDNQDFANFDKLMELMKNEVYSKLNENMYNLSNKEFINKYLNLSNSGIINPKYIYELEVLLNKVKVDRGLSNEHYFAQNILNQINHSPLYENGTSNYNYAEVPNYQKTNNLKATISFSLGLASILLAVLLPIPIAAFVMGLSSLEDFDDKLKALQWKNKWMAITGTILGGFYIFVGMLGWLA